MQADEFLNGSLTLASVTAETVKHTDLWGSVWKIYQFPYKTSAASL